MSISYLINLATSSIRNENKENIGVKPGINNTRMASPLSIIKLWFKKVNKLDSYMLGVFVLIIVLGLGVCSGGQESGHDKSEKHKYEKEDHASEDDLIFFSRKTNQEDLEKNVVSGIVQNKSTQNTYSNILVMVEFYDKDVTFLKSEQLEFSESIEPLEMQKLKLGVDFPEGTKSYKMKIISAEVLPQN